ncbi:COG2827: putative endonuclease containing a URI domain [hydrothermal vent metagenome]|uniref:COG2827: putative endonuclease containing a URI domain n=1 Tax=hydrothermal vent metagenome TaxID=652676 RepID=A0A3B0Y5D7_9ZZZZ
MSAEHKPASDWYVYLLHCADGTYYTGITTDLKRRLHEHNCDDKKAAKYTRARRPLKMVYFELCESRSDAGSREYELRKLPKHEKVSLANGMADEF